LNKLDVANIKNQEETTKELILFGKEKINLFVENRIAIVKLL
jgi:hypothetical protein